VVEICICGLYRRRVYRDIYAVSGIRTRDNIIIICPRLQRDNITLRVRDKFFSLDWQDRRGFFLSLWSLHNRDAVERVIECTWYPRSGIRGMNVPKNHAFPVSFGIANLCTFMILTMIVVSDLRLLYATYGYCNSIWCGPERCAVFSFKHIIILYYSGSFE